MKLSIFLAEIRSPDRVLLSSNNLGLPLAAGLLATRLQGHTMNSKQHPLQKAGYDYGDTLWGTGEGWGYFSPVNEQSSLESKG